MQRCSSATGVLWASSHLAGSSEPSIMLSGRRIGTTRLSRTRWTLGLDVAFVRIFDRVRVVPGTKLDELAVSWASAISRGVAPFAVGRSPNVFSPVACSLSDDVLLFLSCVLRPCADQIPSRLLVTQPWLLPTLISQQNWGSPAASPNSHTPGILDLQERILPAQTAATLRRI